MVGLYIWNDADMIFILELDLKFTLFPKITKDLFFQHHAIYRYHFVLNISDKTITSEDILW